MEQKNKNFIILLINLAIISYMVGGLPKFFSVLSPFFSNLFAISKPDFDNYLYNSTFFSLAGKIVFSFLINTKFFNKIISLNKLFILTIFFHSISLILCLVPSINVHILGRYNQGLWAGILLILLEPIIFNCSESNERKKLLYLKYEMVALLTPMAFLITNLSGSYWSWILMAMAIISLIASWGILFCKSNDNYYVEHQNNLLKIEGFFSSLKNPIIILNNLIIGSLLGCFLVLCQNHYLHIFSGNHWFKGIIQGLPYSLGFLISFFIKNHAWRKLIRNFFIGIILSASTLLFFNVKSYYSWVFIILVNGLYIVFLLWTPDVLNNLLQIKPENISHRSVSTASQLIRSLMTLLMCRLLNFFYQNNNKLNGFYLKGLSLFIIINGFFMTQNINENNIKKFLMGYLLSFIFLFISIIF
jgi:hypothetical protein